MRSAEEVLVAIVDALAYLLVEATSLEAELPGAVEGEVEQVKLPWSNVMSKRCLLSVLVCVCSPFPFSEMLMV